MYYTRSNTTPHYEEMSQMFTYRPQLDQKVQLIGYEGQWTITWINPSYDGWFIHVTQGTRRVITHTDDVTHVNGIRV